MPKVDPEISAYFQNHTVNISFFMEIEVSVGSPNIYYRYCINNFPLITDSATVNWLPWPIDIEEFLHRLNETSHSARVNIFDPAGINTPGSIKSLLQNEQILNRSTFRMWLVPLGVRDNTFTTCKIHSTDLNKVVNFAGNPGLGVTDLIEVGDSNGNYAGEVIAVTMNGAAEEIEVDYGGNGPQTLNQNATIKIPFYKDRQFWVQMYVGKLNTASPGESGVSIELQSEVDFLSGEIPKVTYSYTCPYNTGDIHCSRITSNFVKSATYDVISGSGKTITVDNIQPSGTVVPPAGATDLAYWTMGLCTFKTGGLSGLYRIIRSCVQNGTGYDLTLDRAIPGSISSGTAELKPNCNRTFKDCKDRFTNNVNFDGKQSIIRSVGGLNVPRTENFTG